MFSELPLLTNAGTAKELMWAPTFWRCNHCFDLLRSRLIFSARTISFPSRVKICNSVCARFHMRGLIAQSTRQVFGIKMMMMIHLLWRAWFSVRRRGNFGPLQMPSKSSVSIDQVITWCYHYHILMTNEIIWLLEVNWLLIGWGHSGKKWNILLKGQMMTSLWYIWRKDIYYDKMMMKLINDHPRKPGVIGKLSFESDWALIIIGHPRIAPAMRQYGLIWTKIWHYCQCFV